MTDSLYLVTMQIWQNLNKHYYYLSSIKSVICKIDVSCFQVASQMLRCYINLEHLKLIYYVLISNFLKTTFKLTKIVSFSYFHEYLQL